ncbi:MAG: prolyl oligopeptidase family serine peptidase [Spirochaetales bacterium]|nr:prolyl oligopeptidase family serine peptidase [Spirochaetales bacterium]
MGNRYTTITEGFDWGPAITKIILNLDKEFYNTKIISNNFKVISTRKLSNENKVFTSERSIINCYLNNNDSITLELEVGPELYEGSPFTYNTLTNYNEYVETTYKIFLNNNQLTIDFAGNVNLIADDFIHNIPFKHNNIQLNYAYFTPQKDTEYNKVPLIIWLHGAGEGGENTYITVLGNKVTNLTKYGAYVLVPQTPTIWMDANGTKTYNTSVPSNNGTSWYTEALMALIREFIEKTSQIDLSRIYIGGCSNGGFMTVNMLMTYPDFFSAAFPIATPYLPHWLTSERILAIKDKPIWFTHAKTDTTVVIDQEVDIHTTLLYNKLKEANGKNIHYSLFDKIEDINTNYEYNGHFSWVPALNDQCTPQINGKEISLFEWLFTHSNNQ